MPARAVHACTIGRHTDRLAHNSRCHNNTTEAVGSISCALHVRAHSAYLFMLDQCVQDCLHKYHLVFCNGHEVINLLHGYRLKSANTSTLLNWLLAHGLGTAPQSENSACCTPPLQRQQFVWCAHSSLNMVKCRFRGQLLCAAALQRQQ